MAALTFHYSHRVTYGDCTVGNHVYYSRYLDLLEAARGEFFRQLSLPFLRWQTEGVVFPVVECRVRYRAAAHYDDLLDIELWLTEAERIRLNFAYRVVKPAGLVLLDATTQHVCTTLEDKPQRLPEELVRALQPYVHAKGAD